MLVWIYLCIYQEHLFNFALCLIKELWIVNNFIYLVIEISMIPVIEISLQWIFCSLLILFVLFLFVCCILIYLCFLSWNYNGQSILCSFLFVCSMLFISSVLFILLCSSLWPYFYFVVGYPYLLGQLYDFTISDLYKLWSCTVLSDICRKLPS